MSACCRHYPGRSERLHRSLLIPRRRPSPNFGWVGSCIIVFGACSAFTRVTACTLAESPLRPSTPEASGGFVTSTAAPIATGWSNPVPGRVFFSRCGPAPFHGAPKNRHYAHYVQGRPPSAIWGTPAPHQSKIDCATLCATTSGHWSHSPRLTLQ